jgi:hypothetical protein
MTILTDDLLLEVPTTMSPKAAAILDQIVMGMLEEGWDCRAPSVEICINDAECAEKHPCKQCKGSLHYEPFVKEGRYRAFTVCMDCGDVREF